MIELIDLHTHSCFSDGTDQPEELVRAAVAAGLRALALTDHDTTAGLGRFLAAAEATSGKLEGVPGVEISSIYGTRELHIVGLFIDPANAFLEEFLHEQRCERMERAKLMATKLSLIGYPVTMPELEGDGVKPVGRPHFARYLAEHYRFASISEVFDKLLKRGCPGFVQRKLPNPEAAIEAIHAAGGVAIWAHPVSTSRNERAWLRRMLNRLKPMGLDGIECYYSTFSPQQTAMVQEVAEMFQLTFSGGSDYHGSTQPHIKIGVGGGGLQIPAELLEKIRALRREPRG